MIALSTAFKSAELAVAIDGKKCFKEIDANCKVSENVMSTLDEMLDSIGKNVSENGEYAVVVGPGSFTGLRIGVALVKGLCAGAKDKKVIALSSLGLIAYTYVKENKPMDNFCVVLNALSGLYFVCEFDKNGNAKGEERLIEESTLDSEAKIKVGLWEEGLPFEKVKIAPQTLLEYALKCQKDGKFVNASTFSPVYLRRSQAEVSLDNKNNKKV